MSVKNSLSILINWQGLKTKYDLLIQDRGCTEFLEFVINYWRVINLRPPLSMHAKIEPRRVIDVAHVS